MSFEIRAEDISVATRVRTCVGIEARLASEAHVAAKVCDIRFISRVELTIATPNDLNQVVRVVRVGDEISFVETDSANSLKHSK